MWRKLFAFAAPICVVAPLLILACSSAKDSPKFAANAAQGRMAEVEFGRLATQRAGDSSVREFGARMVADHSRANSELKSIAAQKGIQLPADMNSEQKSEMDKLSKMSGADAEIKAFAAKTLPTLQQHLQMARTAAQNVGAK